MDKELKKYIIVKMLLLVVSITSLAISIIALTR